MGIKAQLIIYGAGGFAREVAWLAEACSSADHALDVACFVDDDPVTWDKQLNNIAVLRPADALRLHPGAHCAIAVGAPHARERIDGKIREAGLIPATVIHPRVEKSRWVEIGAGTIICAGSILTTNIVIGRQVHINLDCTIGHDVLIGDYTTLAPGVHVSGVVRIGRRVSIGTGAVFINGTNDKPLLVGDDAVIGAGACVIRDVAPSTTVGGVPAKPLTGSR